MRPALIVVVVMAAAVANDEGNLGGQMVRVVWMLSCHINCRSRC